jgi:hypothetical protein
MNQKINLFLKVAFVLFSIFAIVRGIYLFWENWELKEKLTETERSRDKFYGQLEEISSIMLEINNDLSKKKLYDSIQNFHQKMYTELKADSIPVFDETLPFYEKQNTFHDYHDELIFVFENDKLIEISYGNFTPSYRRLN